MTFVLSPLTGSGTIDDPFRVEGAQGIIDLRADSTKVDGWALARLYDGADVPTDAVTLVDSRLPDAALERIPKAARDKVKDRLSLSFDSEDLGAVAAEILLSGKDDGSRWRPLKRQADGWWRVFLGGLLWEQSSIDGGASYTDDFERTSLGSDWTEVYGGWSINSGKIRGPEPDVADYPSWVRFEPTLDSADHYTQIEFVAQEDSNSLLAPVVRASSSGRTGYVGVSREGGSLRIIQKIVGGAETKLADFGGGGPVPRTIRLEADGSTLTLFDESGSVDSPAEVGSTTDTEITGNLRAALAGYHTRWQEGDNFLAEDLGHEEGDPLATYRQVAFGDHRDRLIAGGFHRDRLTAKGFHRDRLTGKGHTR